LPQSGLRFFTVYGPWGRPDMAYFSFARAIMEGTPITLYDNGTLRRDFTYIDDIVGGVLGVLDRPPTGEAPRVLNIGNNRSETVRRLVSLLEEGLGRSRSSPDSARRRRSTSGFRGFWSGSRAGTKRTSRPCGRCAELRRGNDRRVTAKGVDQPVRLL
jgi:nucleoside-diphosphate-sugar epimerase